MNQFLKIGLAAGIFVSTVAIADERIWETKNICGLYYATEINGIDAARLLGLQGSRRARSKVEQYCNFFRSTGSY